MSSNADTKPTLETILERLDNLRQEMNRRFDEHDKRFDEQKKILFDFDVRLDRIEGVATMTRSDLVNLRADFREFRQKVEEVMKSAA
jgi:RNA binding exosome subunit